MTNTKKVWNQNFISKVLTTLFVLPVALPATAAQAGGWENVIRYSNTEPGHTTTLVQKCEIYKQAAIAQDYGKAMAIGFQMGAEHPTVTMAALNAGKDYSDVCIYALQNL